MKHSMVFNMSNPEDVELKRLHDQALDTYFTLISLHRYLRNMIKYHGDAETADLATLEMVQDQLMSLMATNEVNLDILS